MNPKWLCLLALFSTLYVLFQMAGALVQVFDAFDRKVFKNRKQRFATFDKQGILTLDGTVNGKSNDIVFPNGEDNFANQNLCNEPKLMFELCETNKFGPWTGLAICYESQLSQPYINPFFRIETLPTMKPMVKAICGERQSAIFINRVPKPNKVVKRPSNSSMLYDKYEPFYSIGASFTEDKILFKMPDNMTEKQCALLHLGGKKSLINVTVTDLRRQPLDLFDKDFKPLDLTQKFPQQFPDLANRKYRINKQQGLWFILLDFSPPFAVIQNISVYGWLPMKVKITGGPIKPCKLDWQLIQSREVSGGLVASRLRISYTLSTGLQNTVTSTNGTTNQILKTNSTEKKREQSTQAELNGEMVLRLLSMLAGPIGMAASLAMQIPGVSESAQMTGIKAAISHSWSNTQGSQEMEGNSANVQAQSFQTTNKMRTETVEFSNFGGTVNIEQLVYECAGMEVRPDQIRYRDPEGNALLPDLIETNELSTDVGGADDNDDVDEDAPDPYDTCLDNVPECPIWSGRGECHHRRVFMLTRCKKSCGICKKVTVDNNYWKGQKERLFKEYEDPVEVPCKDENNYCGIFTQQGLCHKNPLLMSTFCRFSCKLCISKEDMLARQKEIFDQEDGI